MTMTRVFNNGNSQAVRIPAEYRICEEEVLIQRLGSALIILPKEDVWQTFGRGLEGFTPDFILERNQPQMQTYPSFVEVS